MLITLLAFVFALSVLIAGHEWGHYRVAVACGVRVLRFSIGFGPVLVRWKPRRQHPGQDTEFVISAIPLGGYVKMLDEREAPVPDELRHQAFNVQPLSRRAMIVAAGPLANLLMAVILYTAVNWIGMQEPRALLSAPPVPSLAAQAGLHGGDLVREGALAGADAKPIASFEELRWLLTRGALAQHDVVLDVRPANGARPSERVTLPLSVLAHAEPDARLFQEIGIVAPATRPLIGELVPGEAAERAGLQPDDLVLQVDGVAIADGQQLRALIRDSGRAGMPPPQRWRVLRSGQERELTVIPDRHEADGQVVGRIGAMVGAAPETVLVRKGPLAGVWQGISRTWEVSVLSLRVLGRMVVGAVSLKSLSGPVMIADYAGKSVQLGLVYYLGFLAFISVSLGVLNLLPVPVLDGGHLMYYLWEAVTGRAVAGRWLAVLQYMGLAVLGAVMTLAVYNDVVNLLG